MFQICRPRYATQLEMHSDKHDSNKHRKKFNIFFAYALSNAYDYTFYVGNGRQNDKWSIIYFSVRSPGLILESVNRLLVGISYLKG